MLPQALVDHELLDPRDTTVGEEREMGVAEEVADDSAVSRLGNKQQRVRYVDQLRPRRRWDPS